MNDDAQEFDSFDEARQEITRLRKLIKHYDDSAAAAADSYAEPQPYHLYSELLLSHTPNMIFLFDENLDFVIGSKACSRLTGRTGSHLSHRPLQRLFPPEVDAKWVEKIFQFHCEVFSTGQSMAFRDSIEVKGDDTAQVHITISPMIDSAQRKRGTIMAINDVVELVAAQHQAEQMAEARSRFLANMSHEIRTPMNAIKALSELLTVTQLTDTQRVYVKNIIASSNSLISIINDVLDFSKIDANKFEIVNTTYGLEKLIASLCGVMALRAEEKGLQLHLDLDPYLPSQLVGDDNRIRQVLLNLLSNAIKYTNAGHVVLRVSHQALTDNSIKLCFTVEDTGIGVRPKDMPLLFDAYSRVDLQVNRSIQGTGLGLAISKHLSEAMNGGLSLHSVYGKGSSFLFTVPQEIADETPLAGLDNPRDANVLLVGAGGWVQNAAESLSRMWVDHAVLMENGEDEAALLGVLSNPEDRLLRVGRDDRRFTHCIYSGTIPMDALATFRKHLPGCRFAMIRALLHDIGAKKAEDVTFFHPLMITELAKFLNKRGTSVSGRMLAGGSHRIRSVVVQDALALVVDDNRINLMVCEKMLNVFGLSVLTASSGVEALELSESHAFDIAFVDHMMPGMSGIEVATAIRTGNGVNKTTPIVALTANVENDLRTEYMECGMNDFVAKPIDRMELARVLKEWLPPEKVKVL